MLSTLKVVTALIFASIIIYFIWQNKSNTDSYSSSFSQFISLKGADEYVISELKNGEKFKDHWARKIPGTGISYASADAEITLVASYKYYIKLGELKYANEDETLVFNVPSLYLSTPVAFDSSTLDPSCDADLLGSCKGTLKNLNKEVSGKLEEKGNSYMGLVYETSAKALAKSFDSIARQSNEVAYNNIAVVFANEPGQPRHIFIFNKNDCGKEPCSLEAPIGNDGFLKTQ